MKAAIKIFILFIIVNAGISLMPQKASAQASVSFQLFYDDLSPYGSWVDNSNYGYVWVPNAPPGFTPYCTSGHWVLTDYGWTWVSDYPWGWAPFHYGRWYDDPMYGYMWVPGNEWGPGWVTWRQSEGYYGWAPIEPDISIDVAYSNGYRVPDDRWRFVRDRDFGSTNTTYNYVSTTNNTTIVTNSTVINNVQADKTTNTRYNAGPDRTEVQKRTGAAVAPVALKESTKPGQSLSNGELQIYRPRVENAAGAKPVPAKVANLKDVKPIKEQGSEPQPVAQPTKQEQPQPVAQPSKPQSPQSQPQSKPAKQQPSQPSQPIAKPARQQQHNTQPAKQQQSQPQRQGQPNKNQQSQTGQGTPKPNLGGENPQKQKVQPGSKQQLQNSARPNKTKQTQPQQAQPKQEQPKQEQQQAKPEQQGKPEQPKQEQQQARPEQPAQQPKKEEDMKPH